jgi:hypothetical protein
MSNIKIFTIGFWVGVAFFAIFLVLIIESYLPTLGAKNSMTTFFGIIGLLLISFSYGIRKNLEDQEKEDFEKKAKRGVQ